jgi:hypothetical protein
MKRLLIVPIALMLIVSAAAQEPQKSSAPFGFTPGMSKAETIKLIGDSHVKLEDKEGAVLLDTAPLANSTFEDYALLFSAQAGLAKVAAFATVKSNQSGEQVRETFNRIESSLVNKYGKPDKHFDFVHSGALFHEDNEFMYSLLKGERSLTSYWKPRDSTTIMLNVDGHSSSEARIQVTYEFQPEHDAWVAEQKTREQATY